ncbi:hypothetical protein Trydic_g8358 [Trypoxylus dichotomus]
MAQYYQVLSQTEKPTSEELREYYPSIIDNSSQSVQYVIRPSEQTFQGSPILISSDQLMVVDAQPQQLIVDQSQVTFQNQQYILQDTNVDCREEQAQQRIFYMDETSSQHVESVQTDQVPQTIVLNHQLPGAQVLGSLTSSTTPKIVMSLQRQTQLNPCPQPLKQEQTIIPQRQILTHPRLPTAVPPNRTVVAQKSGISQNTPRVVTPIKGRRPISEASTVHYPPHRQEEIVDDDKNPLRYKPLPEKKVTANQIQQPTNHVSNMEYETPIPSQQSRQTKRRPSNRTSTPRSNNRTSGKNSRNATPRPRSMNRNATQQGTSLTRSTQQPQPTMPSSQQSTQNPQYVIQPHGQSTHQQQPVALPPYVPSNQIKKIIESTPLTEEYTDSIRMLVLLSTGEQRLITFTLPKEQCTIQEILEQVGVPIEPETKIECNETNMNGINYIVTVTMPQHLSREQNLEETTDVEDTSFQSSTSSTQKQLSPIPEDPPKPPTPEPPKEQPKYIQGMLAVCSHCGYLSEDFNKCLRCKRKLPEDVKSVAAADQSPTKKNDKLCPIPEKLKANTMAAAKANGTPKSNPTSRKKAKPKTTEQEPIILTLSSDEEEDSNKPQNVTLKIVESQLMPEIKKEPSLTDIQKCDKELICDKNFLKEDNSQPLTTTINCRTIRIGSYRFVPTEDIVVNSSEVTIKVPLPNDSTEIRTITIEKTKIVKVLANFQKMLPVIFYYVIPSCSSQIREQLNMTAGSEYYFDPLSTEEAFRRITILPEHIGDDTKVIFKQIYGKPLNIIDELTSKEANNILLKTCPKEITKAIGITSCFTEIRHLLSYPPGSGGLPINTEDYMCLAQDQFLNDVIIDFYLKFLVLNLPEEKKQKVHVFSTFFYKRLTTKPLKGSRRVHPLEADSSLTPAQKRHARVKNWTKNVNLFEKDFIIIPINESCHWFLAIICFAGMDGCYTFDGKLVKLESKQKKKKLNTTGSVTITQVKIEKTETLPCEDGEASDKDEAEGDDSELESEDDIEDVQLNNVPIKQPCILIFDSLAGASRSRVVATLRDYLACEYKIKMNREKLFNKDTIKCACPKVPQQTNFTDCGLYLLQYVESFFNDPIKNYRLPIHQLKNWFEEITVTKKREDISKLIKELMSKYNKDPGILPEIILPTLNGKLLPRVDEDEEEFDEEDDEEMLEDEGQGNITLLTHNTTNTVLRDSETGENEALASAQEDSYDSSVKPSQESISHNESFDEQTITLIKPDLDVSFVNTIVDR